MHEFAPAQHTVQSRFLPKIGLPFWFCAPLGRLQESTYMALVLNTPAHLSNCYISLGNFFFYLFVFLVPLGIVGLQGVLGEGDVYSVRKHGVAQLGL